MPSPRARSVLLLGMASVLAMLVGLVGSGERPATSRPPPPPAEPSRVERVPVPLSAPAPVEAEAAVVPPVARPEPAKNAKQPASSTRDPRGRLTGIVLYPEGKPAALARVLLGQQQTTCDREGRFELPLVPVSNSSDLLAFAPGHEPALHPAFALRAGSAAEHYVRLVLGPETLVLSGTVVGEDERGLAGWTVELDGTDVLADFGLRERVRTGADGSFRLTDVPAGVHVVRAWKEDRELAFRSVPAAAGEIGITIVARE